MLMALDFKLDRQIKLYGIWLFPCIRRAREDMLVPIANAAVNDVFDNIAALLSETA